MSFPLAETEDQLIGVAPADFAAAHRRTRGRAAGEAVPERQIKEQLRKNRNR